LDFLSTEVDGLVGYNNLDFDSQIIQHIYQKKQLSANDIHLYANKVINSTWPIYKEPDLIIPNLDIYRILHLNNKNRMVGLKWCQFMTDWPNVEDMPFNHNNSVNTDDQADLIIDYCINDVKSTEHLVKLHKKEIDLRISLTNKYGINFMNSSNSSIGSELMLQLYCKQTGQIPDIVRKKRTNRRSIDCRTIIFPYITFNHTAFQSVLETFRKLTVYEKTENDSEKQKHICSVVYKGIRYDYGLGGIHGSLEDTIVSTDDDYIIIDADVASLYPSIAVVNKLFPEHLGEEFAEVYDKDIVSIRLAEKNKPDGDKTIIAGFKEASNSVYGG